MQKILVKTHLFIVTRASQRTHWIPGWQHYGLGLKGIQYLGRAVRLVDNDFKYKFFKPVVGHGDVTFVTTILAPRIFDAPFRRFAVLN